MSRRSKGSNRRSKAVKALARHHEKVASQRRSYCHVVSTALARKYNLIGIEKLNLKGMNRSRLGKSISDASWGQFMAMLAYKAESAGSQVIAVDPRHTSQTCPDCGAIKPKKLSERVHQCPCGCVMDRDVAAAKVILARAVAAAVATRPWREPTAVQVSFGLEQVGPMNREVLK